MSYKPVRPLRVTDRLALTSYDIEFDDDGTVQEVTGALPLLRQWLIDIVDTARYDGGISLNIFVEDHPSLAWIMRRKWTST